MRDRVQSAVDEELPIVKWGDSHPFRQLRRVSASTTLRTSSSTRDGFSPRRISTMPSTIRPSCLCCKCPGRHRSSSETLATSAIESASLRSI